MELNATKCKAMHISRKKSPAHAHYSINESILEQVLYIKDLGVMISNDLSWSKHIENIVSKASRTLGLIKRICKEIKDTNTRRILYCALVRPKLEYASSVWSPYTIKHRLLIKNIRRRAAKFILDYPDVDRLQKTNILPLSYRRVISDLILLFKSKHHIIKMDVNKFLCTYNPGYESRNYDQNNFRLIIKHNQEYYINSYFFRSAKLWNSLPNVIKECNNLFSFRITRLIKLYGSKSKTYKLPNDLN